MSVCTYCDNTITAMQLYYYYEKHSFQLALIFVIRSYYIFLYLRSSITITSWTVMYFNTALACVKSR